jgi:hypothetical protein
MPPAARPARIATERKNKNTHKRNEDESLTRRQDM